MLKNCKAPEMHHGFTLMEMLIAVGIVGLLAGVTLPQLQKMADGIERSNQRANIKLAIEGLGYQAYLSGKPIILGDSSAASSAEKIPFQVPQGWQVQTRKPIIYGINGVCSGGQISITDPARTRETFLLKPPRCRMEPGINSEQPD